jgi:hypothetical protein
MGEMTSAPDSIKTLRRYAREHPESANLTEVLINLQHDTNERGAAITLFSILEGTLEAAIRKRLRPTEDEIAKDIFEGDSILSTFSAKIKTGYFLKLYDAEIQETLNCIRELRNAFAHAKRDINFKTQVVVTVCKRIKFNRSRAQTREARAWWEKHPRDNVFHAATILSLVLDDYAEGRRKDGPNFAIEE